MGEAINAKILHSEDFLLYPPRKGGGREILPIFLTGTFLWSILNAWQNILNKRAGGARRFRGIWRGKPEDCRPFVLATRESRKNPGRAILDGLEGRSRRKFPACAGDLR
ncbi:MAG: hypothetical protein A3I44_04070 [Candidatus Sungbacteria bacterium RIFCSPLOWO2_02_FULL_51_17]|uniref:Uncharacterized protein n=1 Tax=Candidatus Sungbacteria bacterium RIFCSPHIGHO2_02_FULL_51_29 TaxID=1802273 RepID=A0A1G2KS24_9BACT|nr:MAG: hypothetical protein A2676_02585 [Candidatus Sungbacteria bacterium RIFCSPHIGHO2_01_FULL_51_22]OHA02226.1 MAG: hypothetical protein A3C16_03945 [Candidatus Sungbacteria bacterium RIFCSPHIGHO2_02_FULL_51_29]OHA06051.1 MAG: hypothetical protein A3B29_05250 [Candidatus Sungbacteria bacterium RIFCSPLOWO2_01_FULL_51_34]OHA11257.1 MAG: hypothetical protein A3I44_04070 [Candidatus Sungbacteria bacterium RIFCSPLOWO2_02_FULL_51_17]